MSVHPAALFIVSKCPHLTLRKQVHLYSYLLQSEELRHILCGHHPDMFCGLLLHTGTPSCLKSVATWTFNCSCYSLQKGRSIGLAFCLSSHVRSLHVSKYWQQVQRLLTDVT